MNAFIILILLSVSPRLWSREYGLFFEHEKSYLQTGYLTLCDECGVKVDAFINSTSGVLMYAENRVRGVTLVVYFQRPGIYANVTDGLVKYNLRLTLDFFSSDWFGWHDLEIQISETKMVIMFDNSMRQTTLTGKHLFPENVVEENEIYFGASPRWPGTKNVTGYSGFMKNFKYKSCGCDEWRAMEIVNMVGVSTMHMGECRSTNACNEDCSCYLFPWGSKRCECPDMQCIQKSNDVSFDFDRSSMNLGRLHIYNRSKDLDIQKGIIGDGVMVNERSSLVLYVATGRSCFKNIFLCEKGFAHSFWILPKVIRGPDTAALLLKHSSDLESTHGLTVHRIGNSIHGSLVTHEGVQYKVNSPIQLSIWSLVTIIYNKTHLSLYQNAYLKNVAKSSTKLNHKFPELSSTRFLFIGNNKDDPNVQVDNYNFTYNVHLPRLRSIQEIRLEQHSNFRKVNSDCSIAVVNEFIDLTACYQDIFRGNPISEFYISMIFNLQMEQNKMVLIQSHFVNITSESFTTLHLDLRGVATQSVSLKLMTSRLYYVEISMNVHGQLTIRQNLNLVLLNVSLGSGIFSGQKQVPGVFVNKDRQAIADVRLINVDREFAMKSWRIIKGEVVTYSVDFDHNNIDRYSALQLTEGYLDQGLLLKSPKHYLSANWFHGACLTYIASCYHGFSLSFWIKVINKFRHQNETLFKVFSSGERGVSLFIGKDGLYFVLLVENRSVTKFIPGPSSFELYRWCLVELTISPNGIPSLYINGREAQTSVAGDLRPKYKCSEICLRDKNDIEQGVILIIDEIKTWNVERSFLYAIGYLSSDTQSMLQRQKNAETKAKKLNEINTVLAKDKKEMKLKLRKLEVVIDELKREIKYLICEKPYKKPINETKRIETEKISSRNREYLNDIYLEPQKIKCSDDNISIAENNKNQANEYGEGKDVKDNAKKKVKTG